MQDLQWDRLDDQDYTLTNGWTIQYCLLLLSTNVSETFGDEIWLKSHKSCIFLAFSGVSKPAPTIQPMFPPKRIKVSVSVCLHTTLVYLWIIIEDSCNCTGIRYHRPGVTSRKGVNGQTKTLPRVCLRVLPPSSIASISNVLSTRDTPGKWHLERYQPWSW